MTANVLRKELQGFAAAMPERGLYALKPLLTELARPEYVVEPANGEEIAMIEADMAEYRGRPESFAALEYFRAREDGFRPKKAARARPRSPSGGGRGRGASRKEDGNDVS